MPKTATRTKKKAKTTKDALPLFATVRLTRGEASALLSGISVALDACEGKPPESVSESLYWAIEKLNAAFDFGL